MSDTLIPLPQFPTRLAGSFWGITTFFNPIGYKNKLENYKIFRASSKKQGLKLLAVELAFGDKPFELTKNDADIIIQLRTDERNIMWQKEPLINIGFKHLPFDCDKVVGLDCDIIFKNDTWIKETSILLENYMIVQSFSSAVRLPKGRYDLDDEEIERLPCGYPAAEGNMPGFSSAIRASIPLMGRPGLAWAFRRTIIVKHYFYDRLLMGGADTAMAHAFCGNFRDSEWVRSHLDAKTYMHYMRWAESIYKDTRGSCCHANGVVLHLWHGDMAERTYKCRNLVLRLLEYDPEKDVRISEDGLLEWASDKPKLHKAVKEYFRFRSEEGGNFFTSFISSELHKAKDNLDMTRKEISALKSSRTYKTALLVRKLYAIMIQKYKTMFP